MKNFLINGFAILSLAFLFTGCSNDENVASNPGPGVGTTGQVSGFVFQTIKFNYDYVGSAPVLRGTEANDAEFREEIAGDIINKRNLPESHDIAWECAGRDGSGHTPDIANIRIWFEKVCEPVAGYYNIHVWFVRMHVEIDVASHCGPATIIEETWDFWENATALNSHPDNMIPSTSTNIVLEGEGVGFDPLGVDLQVFENGDLLQGRVGNLILPISQYNVKFFIQNQYRNGRGEGFTKEQCEDGHIKGDQPPEVEYIEEREIRTIEETREESYRVQPAPKEQNSCHHLKKGKVHNEKCRSTQRSSNTNIRKRIRSRSHCEKGVTTTPRCAESSSQDSKFPGLIPGLVQGSSELAFGEDKGLLDGVFHLLGTVLVGDKNDQRENSSSHKKKTRLDRK